VLESDDYLKFSKSSNLGLSVNENGDTVQGTTDWMDALTRSAFSQAYNLAVSGATDKSSYRVAFNYRKVTEWSLKPGTNNSTEGSILAESA